MQKADDAMTLISRQAFDAATALNLSAKDAAHVLMDDIQIRTFQEILHQAAPDQDLRQTLVDGLCANDVNRSRASMDKKVRGWLHGSNQPTARQDLLELCFILQLTVEKADAFLAAAGDAGLHWRDPRELVFAFALRHGMTYREALVLLDRVLPDEMNAAGHGSPEHFTPLVHKEASALENEDDLKAYLKQASAQLGAFHNTAYHQFMDLMQLLSHPGSFNGEAERAYTTRAIVETYLDKKIPSTRGKALSDKQRSILSGWPDERALSLMKARKIDVTRKILMLLFLTADGGDVLEEEPAEVMEEQTAADASPDNADDAFRSSYMRMNQMLAGCGYRMLDPRNPFDWVVLYCMRIPEDHDDPAAGIYDMAGLNERLSHVLDVLFASTNPEQSET